MNFQYLVFLLALKVNIVNLYTVNIHEWIKEPANIYIGRQSILPASMWGNPYIINNRQNRGKVIDLYITYISEKKELLDSLDELRGKVLGCWCSPQQCHGEFLHLLAGNIPIYAS